MKVVPVLWGTQQPARERVLHSSKLKTPERDLHFLSFSVWYYLEKNSDYFTFAVLRSTR